MRRGADRGVRDSEEWLRLVFGWVVLLAWATSFVLSAVLPTYQPPASVQALAIALAGYLFAKPVIHTVRSHKPPSPPAPGGDE